VKNPHNKHWLHGKDDDGRMFVEYQHTDDSLHSTHDVRLYLEGNYSGDARPDEMEHAKMISDMLNFANFHSPMFSQGAYYRHL